MPVPRGMADYGSLTCNSNVLCASSTHVTLEHVYIAT